jgi:DnaJ-class molecular chaperone
MFSPGYVKVVQGEGMPSTKAGVANGDLKLRLSVVFPHELSIAQKKELKQVLAGAH